jgi:hypothetical protein
MASPQPESKGVSLQDAISNLETTYAKKDADLKVAQEELVKAQTNVAKCEHEALITLQQLIPLQNRYLVGIIEAQQKQLKAADAAVATPDPVAGSVDRQD